MRWQTYDRKIERWQRVVTRANAAFPIGTAQLSRRR
jgi:hypothetical protein